MPIVPDNYSLGWILGGSAHYRVLLKLLLIVQIMVVCTPGVRISPKQSMGDGL